MYKIIFLFVFIFTSHLLWSQPVEWATYDVDPVVAIDMPGETAVDDTSSRGMKVKVLYSNMETASFVVTKMVLEQEDVDRNASKLPHDLESLKEIYVKFSKGVIRKFPYNSGAKRMINRKGLKGYRVNFVNELDLTVAMAEIYLLNRSMYTIIYLSEDNYDEVEKDRFFKSIHINPNEKVNQFLGKAPAEKMGELFGRALVFLLILVAIIVWVVRSSRKKRLTKGS
jgi:hypothetical protein